LSDSTRSSSDIKEKEKDLLVTTFQGSIDTERGRNYRYSLPTLKQYWVIQYANYTYRDPIFGKNIQIRYSLSISNFSQIATFIFFWVRSKIKNGYFGFEPIY
jgi:hypothetical protein